MPSPNTSLSFATGSTLPPPSIQCLKRRRVAVPGGFGPLSTSQSPLPMSSVACGNDASLAGVIAVIVADADVLDLLGLDLQLRELLDQRDLRSRAAVAPAPRRVAGSQIM